MERGSREQELTAKILGLAYELLELNPGANSLVLSRRNSFVLTMRIERAHDTIPSPPPDPPDKAS